MCYMLNFHWNNQKLVFTYLLMGNVGGSHNDFVNVWTLYDNVLAKIWGDVRIWSIAEENISWTWVQEMFLDLKTAIIHYFNVVVIILTAQNQNASYSPEVSLCCLEQRTYQQTHRESHISTMPSHCCVCFLLYWNV